MRVSSFSVGASSVTENEAPARVTSTSTRPRRVVGRHGQGEDTLSAEHEPAARCPAAPTQSDAAGLDRVLQVRLLTRDLQLPEVLPVETGHQVAGTQASAHGMEGATST